METIHNLRNPPWTIPITFAAFLYRNLRFEVIHVDSMYAHGGQDYKISNKSIVKNLLHSTLKTWIYIMKINPIITSRQVYLSVMFNSFRIEEPTTQKVAWVSDLKNLQVQVWGWTHKSIQEKRGPILRQSSTILGTYIGSILLPWPDKLTSLSLSSRCERQVPYGKISNIVHATLAKYLCNNNFLYHMVYHLSLAFNSICTRCMYICRL